MAAFVKFESGAKALVEGINAATDTWKIALTNTVPNYATDTTLADISDLPTADGYTAGGNACSVVSSSQSGGVYKLVLADPATWTASGSGFTFRFCVLYSATAGDKLVGYWDYGTSVTLNATDTFTIDLNGTAGTFTVQ